MIEPIVIKVVDKVPIVVSGPQYVVCDNSDYTVVWQLDEEWAQFESRTMQVNYKDGTYERVLFTGNSCTLPAIPVPGPVHVGLFAGDIHTTRPARLLAVRSATTDCGEERDPMLNGYAQAIKALNGKLDKNQGAENAGKALVVDAEGNVVPGEVKGGSSLPEISSDTAGKMLTNDGDKAEWGDVPKEVMCVNFTKDTNGNWLANKNWDDAAALIEAGGYVYAMAGGSAIPFSNYAAGQVIVFHTALHNTSVIRYNVVIWRQNGLISASENGIPIVMYGEQTLTADQQAQARKNIGAGTPYDLPIADADTLGGVKPVAKTDAMTRSIGVDANGGLYTEPGAWYVNITGTLNTPTGDKTPAEIYQAYTDGYAVYAVVQMTALYGGMPFLLPLVAIVPASGSYLVAFSASAEPHLSGEGIIEITATWNQRWYLFVSEIASKDDIPTVPSALPNPNALTIKVGDTTTTYDGSAARAVTIPTGGSSGGETWELINTFEVSEADAARVIKIDKDSNGNAFSLKEFAFSAKTNSTKTDGNVYGWFCVNGKGTYNSGLGGFRTNYVRHPSTGAAIANDIIGRALPCGLVYDQTTGRMAGEGIQNSTVTDVHEVELAGYQYTENLLYGTFQLWGVRK